MLLCVPIGTARRVAGWRLPVTVAQHQDRQRLWLWVLLMFCGYGVALPYLVLCRTEYLAIYAPPTRHAHDSPRFSIVLITFVSLQKTEEALTMAADKVNMDVLNGAGAALNDALTNPFFGAL